MIKIIEQIFKLIVNYSQRHMKMNYLKFASFTSGSTFLWVAWEKQLTHNVSFQYQ